MTDKKIPNRYNNSVIAHIMIKGASKAIDFYQRAFNAIEIFRIAKEDGSIIHAEITIEDSNIMLGDAEEPFQEPQKLNGTTVGLHVYVDDVDSLFFTGYKRRWNNNSKCIGHVLWRPDGHVERPFWTYLGFTYS